jgi:hypothetical protein
MKYAKIVQYVKENHISWDTDIFDILKEYTSQLPPVEKKEIEQGSPELSLTIKGQDSIDTISSPLLEVKDGYKIPDNGEYSFEDVINLFTR